MVTGPYYGSRIAIYMDTVLTPTDYSQAKAYCPISLLECTGKLMEKIIANG